MFRRFALMLAATARAGNYRAHESAFAEPFQE
jgi:hypothetical protein